MEETKEHGQSSESSRGILCLDAPVQPVFEDSERQFWCEFSASSNPMLAVASADARVKVWSFVESVKQPTCSFTLPAGDEPLLRVTWYPLKDQRIVVAGDASGKIYRWDLSDESVQVFGEKDSSDQVYALRWCTEGLVVGREDNLSVYCHETNKQLIMWRYYAVGGLSLGGARNPENTCYVFDAVVNSKQTVAAACSDGTVRTRDLRAPMRDSTVIQPHEAYITSCSYSQSETYLAVSAGNGEGSVWDMRTSKSCVYSLNEADKVPLYGTLFVEGTNDSQVLTWSQKGTVTSWCKGTATSSAHVTPNSSYPIYSCSLSRRQNSDLLAMCGGSGSPNSVSLVPVAWYYLRLD